MLMFVRTSLWMRLRDKCECRKMSTARLKILQNQICYKISLSCLSHSLNRLNFPGSWRIWRYRSIIICQWIKRLLDRKFERKESVSQRANSLTFILSHYYNISKTETTRNSTRTKLYWLIGRKSQLSLGNKSLLYKSILKSIYTYGIQLWDTALNSNIESLQKFQ